MNEPSGLLLLCRSERWREFASACLNREGLGGMLAQLLAEVDR